MQRSLAAVACALIAGASLAAHAQSEPSSVPLFDDLGSHHYAITTATPLAQRYFDQGLRLYYGFNHAESIRVFEEATRQDPECAMCYWGIAIAYGPNINAPMVEFPGFSGDDAGAFCGSLRIAPG